MLDDTAMPKTETLTAGKRRLMSRRGLLRLSLLIIVPLVITAAALEYWLQSQQYVSTENAYVKTKIARLASEVSGRVLTVNADAHLKVKKDDILVSLDDRPFEIAVKHAKAELDASRREIEVLNASLNEARTELEEAKDRAVYFRKRFERQINLAKQGITTQTRQDELENDANTADDRVSLARQKIRRIMTSLGGGENQEIDDHPLVRSKRAALEQAELDLEHTNIRAPADGTVVTVPLVPGEQIRAAEPLFAIVTDVEPWVDANFKETELTHVRIGQRANITLDIYPEHTWEAEVQSISPATGAEFSILPPQNASGNWVKVVQRLPVRLKLITSPDDPPLRAGMTAKVKIDTKRERSLTDLLREYLTNRDEFAFVY
jgi:membrane fusion protein (multidrug efflux system)